LRIAHHGVSDKQQRGLLMPSRKSVSRRDFLKGAAALAAAPYAVTTAWGHPAPSERTTLGLIGIGNMGGGHLRSLVNRPEMQILAVCDVDQRKRDAARQDIEKTYAATHGGGTYRGCTTYNEYERLLAREDIDAVLIAVPDHWHAIIATAACRAGKDVYCEKPLSLTVREAEEMTRAARRYGRVFQTGSQQRSAGNFRKACELVRSGRIGTLKTVHVGIGGPSVEKYLPPQPVPPGFDWDRWLGPTPWYPYNAERCSGSYSGGWRLIRNYSGGMMTDWGAHHFDIAQWGMGMDGSGPIEIIPPGLAPHETLTYRYANGVTMFHGGANGVLFTGTEGKIEVNRGHFQTWPASIGQSPLGPNDVHLYESPGHHQDWIDCIRQRRRPICDVAVGASSVTVCHLGNIAWWLGRTLRWDPDKHVLLNDPEAGRWLDRPKRSPWRLDYL
jgi:predicted dehydrogenase